MNKLEKIEKRILERESYYARETAKLGDPALLSDQNYQKYVCNLGISEGLQQARTILLSEK